MDRQAGVRIRERVHVGHHAVDEDARGPTRPRRRDRDGTDRRVGVVAAHVDDQHLTGSQCDERAVHRRGVRSVEGERGGRTGHPTRLPQPSYGRIDEAVFEQVAESGQVDVLKAFQQLRLSEGYLIRGRDAHRSPSVRTTATQSISRDTPHSPTHTVVRAARRPAKYVS